MEREYLEERNILISALKGSNDVSFFNQTSPFPPFGKGREGGEKINLKGEKKEEMKNRFESCKSKKRLILAQEEC